MALLNFKACCVITVRLCLHRGSAAYRTLQHMHHTCPLSSAIISSSGAAAFDALFLFFFAPPLAFLGLPITGSCIFQEALASTRTHLWPRAIFSDLMTLDIALLLLLVNYVQSSRV